MKTHFPPPPEECFECCFANCEHRRLKGFVRRDKLLQQHRKEHEGLWERNRDQIYLYDGEFEEGGILRNAERKRIIEISGHVG